MQGVGYYIDFVEKVYDILLGQLWFILMGINFGGNVVSFFECGY